MILDSVVIDYIKPNSGIIPKKCKLFGFYPSKSHLINLLMREFRMSFKEAKQNAFKPEYENWVLIKK